MPYLSFTTAGVGAVSVVLCYDPYITKLNANHRGKAAPTDVLSFGLEDDLDFKVSQAANLLYIKSIKLFFELFFQ